MSVASLYKLLLLVNVIVPIFALHVPQIRSFNSFARGWIKPSPPAHICSDVSCDISAGHVLSALDPAAILSQYRGGRMKENNDRSRREKKKFRPKKKKIMNTDAEPAMSESPPFLLRPDSCIIEQRLEGPSTEDSVVLMNPVQMKTLELYDDDVILVKANRNKNVVAVVKSNITLTTNTLQMTDVLRANIRTRIGQKVHVESFPNIKFAKSVQISAFKDTIKDTSADLFADYLKPYFVDQYLPMKLGQTFTCQGDSESDMTSSGDAESIVGDTSGSKNRMVEFKITSIETFEDEDENKDNEGENKEKEASSIKHVGDYCIIGPETEIVLDSDNLERLDEDSLYDISYDDIGGCGSQLSKIREVLELPLRHPELFRTLGISPPRGVLMHGPPGTGKTMIARAVAAETGAYFYLINGPEIMSKMSGESESNLRKAFAEAEKNSPAIIFIDEIDSIASKRDKAGGEVEKRVVSQLLTLMDGIKPSSNVVVLAATNRPNALDPALRRFGRFDREIDVGIPDEQGRLEILQIKSKNMKLSKSCDLHSIAKETHGYVGADLGQLCMEGAFQSIREKMPWFDIDADVIPQSILDSIEINQKHLLHGLAVTNPSALRENIVEIPDVTWDDVGGLEDVKRELFETIQYPVQHEEKYRKFGMEPSKGVLLYGPPGTGKTLLAKAVANECGANFISVKGPELLTMWFGESEANVRDLFDKARAAAPCILFFDEIDSIAKARGSGGSGGGSDAGDRVINQILTEIDGVGTKKSVFVIGATNRPDILDPAVMRPGRFDQLVYIPMPDLPARLSIFTANLRKSPVSPDVDLNVLAAATDGLSGADITEICQRAAKNAVIELVEAEKRNTLAHDSNVNHNTSVEGMVPCIRRDHFEEALSRARRSISEEDLQQYEVFRSKMKTDSQTDSAEDFNFHTEKKEEEGEEEEEEEEVTAEEEKLATTVGLHEGETTLVESATNEEVK